METTRREAKEATFKENEAAEAGSPKRARKGSYEWMSKDDWMAFTQANEKKNAERRSVHRTRAVAKQEREQEASWKMIKAEPVQKVTAQEVLVKEEPEVEDFDEAEQMNIIRQDLIDFRSGTHYGPGSFRVMWPTVGDTAEESDDSASYSRTPFQEKRGLSIDGIVRGSFGDDTVRINLVAGTCDSSISHERWHRNGCASLDTVTPPPPMRNANGHELEVCGRARILLVIEYRVYAVSLWVVHEMEGNIVLGADFLRTQKAVVDMAAMKMFMKDFPGGVALSLEHPI